MSCHDPLIAGCPLLRNNPQSEAGYFYLLLRADPARCLAGKKPLLLCCCLLLQLSWVLRTTQNFLHLLCSRTQTGLCLCDRPCLPSLVSRLVGRDLSLLPCCCCGHVCTDSPPSALTHSANILWGSFYPSQPGPQFPRPSIACAMAGPGLRALMWGPDTLSR